MKEINSGCICCSLSGNFIEALKELLDRLHPDKIIIEPSGVGKLSDIEKACLDPRILSLASVRAKITVVDVKRCNIYLENFGEFFEDQVKNADIILLSRTQDFPGKINDASNLVKRLNADSAILSKPWNQISAAEILHPGVNPAHAENHGHAHECGCGQHGKHNHGGSAHDCNLEHNHSAEEAFDTVTIRTNQIYSVEDLKARVFHMENAKGTVLRAKGIVRAANGYINLQYLPGDIRITECAAAGDMLCVIGRNLNRQELCTILGGE